MFHTVATVSKVEYDAVTDSFWIKAEVVLSQEISRLEIDPGQLNETSHPDILKDKGIGKYVLAINGIGKPQFKVGHKLKATGFLKTEKS
jgi:hypothetical protein